ncbi:MAG: hypothetical protein U0T73_03755 [Chitinophagales bacterium]
MKNTFTAVLCVWCLLVNAGTGAPKDKWIALIEFASISSQQMHKAAPHFPAYTNLNEAQQNAFQAQRKVWVTAFPNEVKAFLALPAVKQLNPSLVDLELKKENQEGPRVFSNPFKKWVDRSGLTDKELKSLAPHFPQQLQGVTLDEAEKQYSSALSDWMILYTKEYESLINHPKLTASNKNYNGYVTIESYATDSAYLILEPAAAEPQRADFNSGNQAFDDLRFQQYKKAWYYRNYKVKYFELYEPEKLAGYLKEREMEQNDKGQR